MKQAECRITSPLNLPAPGRCQTLYVGLTPSAESCVFSKQSPGPGFCDPQKLGIVLYASPSGAPLLPRLRGQLAEFLSEGSLVHLSLLSQPTCVGFGYGRPDSSLEAFLGGRASMPSPHMGLPIRSQGFQGTGFPWSLPLRPWTGFSSTRRTWPPASPLRSMRRQGGAGMSTCCPSTTPCGLALGPALPWVDQPSPGTLGLPVNVVLTRFSLLMPAFSLPYSPPTLTGQLHPVRNAPLPST